VVAYASIKGTPARPVAALAAQQRPTAPIPTVASAHGLRLIYSRSNCATIRRSTALLHFVYTKENNGIAHLLSFS
jgi:hypothetical protein